MKKIMLLIPAICLLSACAGQMSMMTCAGSSAHTQAFLDYGADGITMKAKTEVDKKQEFWIKLRPGTGFKDTLVTIDGVTGTLPLPGGGTTNPDWLDTSGTWNGQPNHRFVLCVPDVATGTEYKFDVIIDGLGRLDPRVHVR